MSIYLCALVSSSEKWDISIDLSWSCCEGQGVVLCEGSDLVPCKSKHQVRADICTFCPYQNSFSPFCLKPTGLWYGRSEEIHNYCYVHLHPHPHGNPSATKKKEVIQQCCRHLFKKPRAGEEHTEPVQAECRQVCTYPRIHCCYVSGWINITERFVLNYTKDGVYKQSSVNRALLQQAGPPQFPRCGIRQGRQFWGLFWLKSSGLLKTELPGLWDSEAGITTGSQRTLLLQNNGDNQERFTPAECLPAHSSSSSSPFFLLLLLEQGGLFWKHTSLLKHTNTSPPPQAICSHWIFCVVTNSEVPTPSSSLVIC